MTKSQVQVLESDSGTGQDETGQSLDRVRLGTRTPEPSLVSVFGTLRDLGVKECGSGREGWEVEHSHSSEENLTSVKVSYRWTPDPHRGLWNVHRQSHIFSGNGVTRGPTPRPFTTESKTILVCRLLHESRNPSKTTQ